MSDKHTRGPWTIRKDNFIPENSYIDGPGETPVCALGAASMLSGSVIERAANARLIAAAPDLLEALKEIVGVYDKEMTVESAQEFNLKIDKGRAAIKAATEPA